VTVVILPPRPLPETLVLSDDDALAWRLTDVLADAGFAVVDAVGASDATRLVVLASVAAANARLDALTAAAQGHPGRLLLATMPADASGTQLRKAVRAGAAGIVLDDVLDGALVPTALAVAAGQLVVPTALARRLAPRALSYREKEILGLVVRGYTNRQIADALFLAESTVKTHLSSAFGKLDARSRAEAAALVLDPEEGIGLDVLVVVPAERKIREGATVESL
jgi:DNA-binding NarL/FixJ family response regulator